MTNEKVYDFNETLNPFEPEDGYQQMHSKQIRKNLFIIDLQTGGFRNLIASYVLKGTKTTIIDTGPTSSIPNLLQGLRELDVKLEDVAYIALSHVHVDHGGGAGTLLKLLPNAKILVHPRGAPHMVNPEKLWSQTQLTLGNVAYLFGEPEPVPENRIIGASDGMEIDVGGGMKLEIIETLGHASHHMSHYETLNECVFPGDAAGIYLNQFDVIIPTSPPPFHLDAALASLDKLIALKPKLLCYSHFGEASDAVERLQEHALQLKLWAEIAEDGTKKRQSPNAIRERIIAEDKNMREIAGFLRSHPIYSKVVIEESMKGFIDSASKRPV